MAPTGNIRDFFKPKPRSLPKMTAVVLISNDELPRPPNRQRSSANSMKEASIQGEISQASTNQRVIRSSDDEESNSDSSLEDLSNLLQVRNPTQVTEPNSNGLGPSTHTRSQGRGRRPATLLSAVKPKYQFDMKELVSQAELYKSAEASALSLQTLLDETSKSGSVSPSSRSGAAHTGVLESVIAEQEGASLEKVLQAVKRTEATQTEKRCYVFEPNETIGRPAHMPMPKIKGLEGWKKCLTDPLQREHIILSDFARDMITLGDVLPDDLFLWILHEMCLESRHDFREAYSRILMVSTMQVQRLISQETVMKIFRQLGVKELAVDTKQKLNLVSSKNIQYGNRDWTSVRTTIAFMSKISDHLSSSICAYIFCLLARLCVDTAVLETIGLLSAIQITMVQASKSFKYEFWEKSCREICESIFHAVDPPTLRLQMLRCIPQTTTRTHEIRRRLALAFFFEDPKYLTSAPQLVIDLLGILKRLDEPQFEINRDTDYQQLAALITVLDIAIDNAQTSHLAMSDAEEERFNAEIDTLAARIRNIWSSINDAGASYMSRVDTKEVMECLRHRLLYAIRTKPVPKRSIFNPVPDDTEQKLKQSKLISKYFIKPNPDKG